MIQLNPSNPNPFTLYVMDKEARLDICNKIVDYIKRYEGEIFSLEFLADYFGLKNITAEEAQYIFMEVGR
jgi:hypothetical protein